jgi:LmbE family N-acetylglucosaminyl deacetylase
MNLRNAVLIVAHPDDEVLWFASILKDVGRIVMCYGASPSSEKMGGRRRRAIAEYPLDNVSFLDLPQPARTAGPDWDGITDPVNDACRQQLGEAIANVVGGAELLVTHNPWGEYGHLDHRLVHATVSAIAARMGNRPVLVSSYVGVHAFSAFTQTIRGCSCEEVTARVDRTLAHEIRDLYQAHGCWTWQPDWEWPEEERFFRFRAGRDRQTRPLAVLSFDHRNWIGFVRRTAGERGR